VNLGLFDDWESLRSLGGRVMGCWLKRFKGGADADGDGKGVLDICVRLFLFRVDRRFVYWRILVSHGCGWRYFAC
jgi:hypothetical protein